ncbi:MAG: ComF family protein, partial [Clostridium sp.]
LGNALSRRLDIPCVSTLIKTKETKDQKTLTIRERKNNVKNVFEGKNINLIKGNKFILIDDVITTGATIEEGVRVLKKYGAKEIKILTIAKSHV